MTKLSKFISNFIQSSKSSSGSKEYILAEHYRKFHGTLKSFPLGVQKNQVLGFLLKRFFLRKILWTREMQILKPYNFFCQKSENTTINLKNRKHLFFPKNYLLLKKLFWRHKLRFWQPSSKIVSQNPKNFTHKVRKHVRISNYWSIFYLVKKMHFWKSCQRVERKVSFSSAQDLKLTIKNGSFTLKQTAPMTVFWSRRMSLSLPGQNLSIGGRK